jgi:hypothetical protein
VPVAVAGTRGARSIDASMTAVAPPASKLQPSRARWDAIVVGSGVGGSVTSALLAAAGKRVLFLEKN